MAKVKEEFTAVTFNSKENALDIKLLTKNRVKKMEYIIVNGTRFNKAVDLENQSNVLSWPQ